MSSFAQYTVPLFFGLNEIDIPSGSTLVAIHIIQNDIEAEFKGPQTGSLEHKLFYVALGNEQIPAYLGVFRHLKSLFLQDKAYTAEVFEIFT
ncbi:hypothetical protein GCM10023189_16310 [Nibrella saemangeumensis]|uniref:Uncharacterized protein n=1 Tax=Nibrella saemangeumensis TaxID=1084526 RepID=A0ABP8MM08_9BACT